MPEVPVDHIDALVDHLAGRLDPEADRAFLAHAATCEGCRSEVDALAPVTEAVRREARVAGDGDAEGEEDSQPSPDLEARVGAALREAKAASASAGGADALVGEADGTAGAPEATATADAPRAPDTTGVVVPLDRMRRGRRILVAVAGVAALVLALVGVAVLRDSPSSPAGESVALTGKVGDASADAILSPRPYGTELHIEASGLQPGRVYALWMADEGGEKIPAGTFRADADGTLTGTGNCSLARNDATKVWITDPGGTTVAVAPLV
jgi:hypothetical protein